MERLNETVSWYQHKIGTYDKQHWEKSVEEQVIKNIQHVPKKATKVKPELIDVDLVRGSTFTKAKPQHGWMAIARRGILRILFLPLYFRWWQKQTSLQFWCFLLLLYILQVAASVAYIRDSGEHINDETLSVMHILTPVLLMMILGTIHSHIVSTHVSHKQKISQSKGKRRAIRARHRKVNSKYRNSDRESGTPENGETFTQYRQRKRATRSSSNSFVKFEQNLEKKLIRLKVDKQRDTEDEESSSLDRHTNSSTKGSSDVPNLKKSNLKNKIPVLSTKSCPCEHVPRENGFDITDCNMTYKSVDGSEDVTCNSYEDPQMLNEPITEFAGELCVVGPDELKINGDVLVPSDLTADASGEDSADEKTRSRSDSREVPYIPSDHEQDQGRINLVGIKKRKQIGQKVRRRHVTSNKVDDLTQEVSEQPESLTVSDPLVLNDMASGTDIDLEKVNDTVNGECADSISAESSLNSSQNYIPSDHHTDYGKIDLVGIKKRNLVGKTSTGVQPLLSTDHKKNKISLEESPRQTRDSESNYVPSSEMKESTGLSSCDTDMEDTTVTNTPCYTRGQTSEMEWEETINTDESTSDTSACTSDSDLSDKEEEEDPFGCGTNHTAPHTSASVSSSALNMIASDSDKVSVLMWEENEVKKVDLSVLDIAWTIIRKVDNVPETCDYLVFGIFMSLLIGTVPAIYRGYLVKNHLDLYSYESIYKFVLSVFGCNWSILLIVVNGMIQRMFVGHMFFFVLSVAERTFKQRLQYAKHFCYLTSSRRARKYELPHFRLNKVRNIKTWLSLRSYLKKRGPQRSVDTIVSAAFILNVILVSLLCIELLKSSEHFIETLSNWELVVWCMALGIYLLRFMTLGTKINKKYRNFSVLITEQINLYLHMEKKPHKKEELLLANSVLKLAEDLIKELESPFKISGLSANPFLYNITKVVILSAFSAVLTELVGFKLKLYKIKLKA